MTTVETGRRAESAAAAFLEHKGYLVVVRNWRTRMCEIDIVAKRGQELCFCEVKYRKTNRQGSGLDYITPKKLAQMRFAAQSWVHAHGWRGEYYLAAIEVSGESFRVTNAIKNPG
ncbi:MAG TPA: YraN family protein [Candidatus Saccharimonadales bacterium]|nr:YraN family protein [Candidatus Saccharimonadales bacterium]